MAIEARDITKRFGDYLALDDVTIRVPDGSLTALLGPSGSGKSTLLRVIAGLEAPDAGTVLIGREDVTAKPARSRGVGFVFQHYAAFKHMTVADNVAFGLTVRKRPKAERRAKVAELLDEPFGALDARVREELRRWLRRLHDDVHVTTIFVTHDQEEAMEISEQIVVVNEGRIEQSAAPVEIYDHPATRVAGTLVRPHDIQVLTEPAEASEQAVVTRIVRLGFEVRVELLPAEGDSLTAQLSRTEADQLELVEGQIVHLRVDPVT